MGTVVLMTVSPVCTIPPAETVSLERDGKYGGGDLSPYTQMTEVVICMSYARLIFLYISFFFLKVFFFFALININVYPFGQVFK